ncbi:MAG: DUF433 domain-containing protein [Planctomycetota bacterium]
MLILYGVRHRRSRRRVGTDRQQARHPHARRLRGGGGKLCVAGTRIRVWDIDDWYSAGHSVDEIIEQFPHLTRAQAHGAMAY